MSDPPDPKLPPGSRPAFGLSGDGIEEPLSRRVSSEGERRALSLFSVVAVAVIAWVIMPVGMGIFLGTLTAFALQPVYERLLQRTQRPKLSALICVAMMGFGIAGSLAAVSYIFVGRAVAMAEALLASLAPEGAARAFIARLGTRFGFLHLRLDDLTAKLRDAAAGVASRAAQIAGALAHAAFSGFLTLLFATMTVYFILRHWELITRHAEDALPLASRHTHALLEEFRKVGRLTLLGTLVTGVAQGLLAFVGYAVLGVPEAAFFGAATAIASLLPGVGTMLVWVPLGIFLFATGEPGRGIVELIYGSAVVVGVSDYVIRPRLVGGHGSMPALLTFASLFGGVEVFGLLGLLLGPLLVSISVSLLRIYAKDTAERKAHAPG